MRDQFARGGEVDAVDVGVAVLLVKGWGCGEGGFGSGRSDGVGWGGDGGAHVIEGEQLAK